ncbi:MAG: lipopolysaccharide biosynthesis protein [Candidatus Eremiobacteraeota bacterium]|nr:lipopolysaccharide biosynthesis protein [Candidatus Eremiobacteraeota bacterium]
MLNALGLVAGFAMHALVARKFGAAGYGVFGVILAGLQVAASPAALGWLEGLPKLLVEFRANRDDARLSGVVVRAQQTALAMSGLVALGLGAFGHWAMQSDPELPGVLAGMAVLLPVFVLSRLQQQVLLTLQYVRQGLLFVHLAVPATVVVAALISPGLSAGTLICFYWVGMAAACVGQGLAIVRALPGSGERTSQTRRWLGANLPLVLGTMSQRLVAQGDLLVLTYFAGLEVGGVYALSRRLVDLIVFGNRALASALAPMLGAAVAGGEREEATRLLWRGAAWSTLWALPWSLAGLLAAEFILGQFGASFVAGAWILRILILGGLVNAMVGPVGQALLVAGQTTFWRNSALLVNSVTMLGFVAVAPWGQGLAVASVRSGCDGFLNLWRWRFLQAKIASGEPRSEPQIGDR